MNDLEKDFCRNKLSKILPIVTTTDYKDCYIINTNDYVISFKSYAPQSRDREITIKDQLNSTKIFRRKSWNGSFKALESYIKGV